MAFTAGYWALGALQPDVLAFLGCDMNYQTPQTHFYGAGTADPLRADITLQSLEAKSARLMVLAAQRECLCINLSELAQSRQVFPRRDFTTVSTMTSRQHANLLRKMHSQLDTQRIQTAQALESQLGYMVPSGRYWQIADRFDAEQLQKIDDLWLGALESNQ
jgi:lactam utilization protein B